MKLTNKILPSIVIPVLLFGLTAMSCNQNKKAPLVQVSYEQTVESFANPERGLYVRYSTSPGGPVLDAAELRQDRENNQITVIGRAYNIPEYRNSDFPAEFLHQIGEDFNAIRDAGGQ